MQTYYLMTIGEIYFDSFSYVLKIYDKHKTQL